MLKRLRSQHELPQELFRRAKYAQQKGEGLIRAGKTHAAEAWLRRAKSLLDRIESLVGEPLEIFPGWAGAPSQTPLRVVERKKPPRKPDAS